MVSKIADLVETDFCFDMDLHGLPDSPPFTQEEASKMANIIGKVYLISHCIHCGACQGKYKIN